MKKERRPKDRLFEQVITKTLKELPSDLKAALETVQIVVQKRPSPEQLRRAGRKPGDDLLGLFDGLSLKDWPLGADRHFPDRVILYEDCLRKSYPDRGELARQVRVTLVHELGHYFGFSEKELKSRGLG
jgi:predicted Zn-dependent protease with MMP-like domain